MSGDQLLPLYVMDAMGHTPGLTGLFLAGVCSSAMCSASAALNSLAAVTLEDYVMPLRSAEIADQRRVLWLKALVIVYGTVAILLAFCAHFVGPLLQASMTVLGIIGGPMLAVFTLGILVPYVNQKGSLIGMVVGLVTSFALGLGGPKPPVKNLPTYTNGCLSDSLHDYHALTTLKPKVVLNEESYAYVYRISYMYYVVIGFAITAVVALVASLFFESDVDHLDPRLFFSAVARKLEKRARATHKKHSTSSKTVTFSIDA